MADGEAEEAAPAEEPEAPPAKKRKKKKEQPKPDVNFTGLMQHFYKELVLGFIKVVPDEERQRRLAELPRCRTWSATCWCAQCEKQPLTMSPS